MPLPANKIPKQSNNRRSGFKLRPGELLLLAVWLAILGLVAANRQNISDWWHLRGYRPPAAVAQLASQDTMNDYTRHLFYLNRPELLPTVSSFRKYCPENENTIVLGCYHAGQNGIFIYNVQDPALAGVQQVTAAHEVLHSIYARLSTKDRNYVDGLLENYYRHGLQDPQVKAEVKIYQQTEPHDVMDEMNSTFGTEIAKLPAPLEAYYKRFFTNRSAIVAYEKQYETEFTTRQSAISGDDSQLAAMKQSIDSREAALTAALAQVNNDQSRLDGLRSSGQISSYNSLVGTYNSEVDAYNSGVDSLTSDITSYNRLVAARNQIAGQLTTLDNSLDTRLTPQQTAH